MLPRLALRWVMAAGLELLILLPSPPKCWDYQIQLWWMVLSGKDSGSKLLSYFNREVACTEGCETPDSLSLGSLTNKIGTMAIRHQEHSRVKNQHLLLASSLT